MLSDRTAPASARKHRSTMLPILVLGAMLAACGGGSSGPPTYTVGGTVEDLASGTSVSLQNNGVDLLIVRSNSTFTFATPLTSGSHYTVTISAQPTGQTCAVTGGSGAVTTANITGVFVTCHPSYSVGGTVQGLRPGSTVTLLDNDGDSLTISSNSLFTFSTLIPYLGTYKVTVGTQPPGQTCSVSYGGGLASDANVTNITVQCATEVVLWNFDVSSG